jgi:hypothetical protein
MHAHVYAKGMHKVDDHFRMHMLPCCLLHCCAPQALGQQSEYMRATTASKGDSSGDADSKSEISRLIADKQQLQKEADAAKAAAAAAAKDLAAVKAQAQVRVLWCSLWGGHQGVRLQQRLY